MAKQVIWKQEIAVADEQSVRLRSPGEIIHFGIDPNGHLCIWFTADPNNFGTVNKTLKMTGTGIVYDPDGLKFIGTVRQGSFMWHLFEQV
jgi:hypothetical protein